jgi:hypothetical protein
MAQELLDPPDLDDDDDLSLDVPFEQEPPPLWERQPNEHPKAYHAFCHYRDLKVRSQPLAYREHKLKCEGLTVTTIAPRRWGVWSAEWKWRDRCAAYDTEIERQVRERLIKAQVEARERHARMAQATLTTLTMPIKAVLEASQNRDWMKGLTDAASAGPHAAMAFIRDISRIAGVFPGLVAVERLALGMSTEAVEIDDKRDDDLDAVLAKRIIEDPAATELAIQLLNHVANTGKGAALGPSPFGESGPLVPDGAPELPDEETG